RGYRDTDYRRTARSFGARRRAGADGPHIARFRNPPGERSLPGVDLAHARERLLVLRAWMAVSAGGGGHAGRHFARGRRARDHVRHAAAWARVTVARARVRVAVSDHLAESRADPGDGAAGHSGALS